MIVKYETNNGKIMTNSAHLPRKLTNAAMFRDVRGSGVLCQSSDAAVSGQTPGGNEREQ